MPLATRPEPYWDILPIPIHVNALGKKQLDTYIQGAASKLLTIDEGLLPSQEEKSHLSPN